MFHEDQDSVEVCVLPDWQVVIMEIIQNRIGVPSLVEEDGTVIYLQHSETDNLQAIEMLDSAVIDGLYEHIKKAIAVFTPLDPSLPDGEWMMEYNQLSLINEFQTALIVLNQARAKAARDMEAFEEEELV